MFTISKKFEFSASHVLEGLPEGHQCGRLHGHNYIFEVELRSEGLDPTGFVLDYGELKPVKAFIDAKLDHRHLNDVVPGQPCAEGIAKWFYEICCSELGEALCARDRRVVESSHASSAIWVSAVRVYETPKTCAEYRP